MARKLKNQLPPLSNIQIGKRIAVIRKERGLTQTQLAERIGINQRLVSDYEVGRVGISAEMLARFCSVLQCSADSLITDIPIKELSNNPNLKLTKRLKHIEQLPPMQQKVLLQNIDMFLKGAKVRQN